MKQKILEAATKLAQQNGARKIAYPARVISKEKVAKLLKIPSASINYYWETVDRLTTAVLQNAVKTRNAKVIAWGLIERHPVAIKAPRALRRQAANIIAA